MPAATPSVVCVVGRFVGTCFLASTVFGGGVLAQQGNAASVNTSRESPTPTPPSDAASDRGFPVRVSNVRMEHSTDGIGAPTTIVKFHTSNDGTVAIEHVVFAISIVVQPASRSSGARPRVLAGPFVVRAHVGLEPGFTADYEIGLRDVSAACGCTPDVRIVSVLPHDD